MTPEEEWRPIPGYEGRYEASSTGRIRSVTRRMTFSNGHQRLHRGRVLKACTSRDDPHLRIPLRDGAKKRTYFVHSLICATFLGPRPDGADVCHNNGDATDNRVENIRYDTRASNIADAVRHGTHWQTRKTHCPAGHPYTPENTLWEGPKHRKCRECNRIKCRRKHLARKAKN
ncbi:NUMOD4 motif-containing HNH endonuclease [Corynebacterium glyciniphilum]|uniref:NUMOD4 motif-containing HNH endonuclease n=1 Tax=Corynebacterium glyciniphilum TaxID=1404244 RepID=UPI003FD65E78